MLTRLFSTDNTGVDAGLDERRRHVAALLGARRVVALSGAVVALATLLGWLPLSNHVAAILLAGGLATELERVHVGRARSSTALERGLAVFAFAYVSLAASLLNVTADVAWAGPMVFVLVIVGTGTLLTARALFAVTAFASLAFAGLAIAQAADVIPYRIMFESGSVAGPPIYTDPALTGTVVAVVAGFLLPAISFLTYQTTRRLRSAQRRAQLAASELRRAEDQASASRDELRSWRDRFDREVSRKTEELEEQNRYLTVINAVSFALSGPMDEEGAVERAGQLIARVVQIDAAQLYMLAFGEHPSEHVVVASEAGVEVSGLDQSLMRGVAEQGLPLIYPAGDAAGGDDAQAPALPHGVDAYAVVPVVSKGRTIGAFAALGQRPDGWGDHELHMLMLVGRELGVALDNARLYREAMDSVAQEALLGDVVRILGSTDDAGRALTQALELVATRIGARVAAVSRRRPRGGATEVMACYAETPTEEETLSSAVLAAPSLVADRSSPMVFGEIGEAPLSTAMAAAGVGTLVMAPIVVVDTETVEGVSALAGERASGSAVSQKVAAALVLASRDGVRWGQRHIDLVERLSSVLARRLETDALLRLQERRISELSGLAEVAATVQSTIDAQRLYSGFARAMHTLVAYQHLYIARVDDDGALTEVITFGPGGRALTTPPLDAAEGSHPWFAMRSAERWLRAEAEPPAFVDPGDHYALLAPMRPKGQILGAVVIATPEPPEAEQCTLVAQAVEQLALALDSAALYRQATERAARIQVLGNLAAIVASSVDLREAFDGFAEEVRWLIPFDRALMLTIEEGEDAPRTYATYPEQDADAEALDPISDSLARVAAQELGPVAFVRSPGEHSLLDWSAVDPDVQAVAVVPVVHGGVSTAVFALLRLSAQPFRPEDLTAREEVAGLLAVTIDRPRLFERAEPNARHDPLTGLPNLRFLHERLAQLRGGLSGEGESALLMIDMDDLKIFNDTLGHEQGDRVLQLVAEELRSACRSADFIARVGGDEFVVLMEGAGLEAASSLARRVHERLAEAHARIPGAPTQIRVSIGIACAPDDGTTAQELIRAADEAMYDAKLEGGRRTRMARNPSDPGRPDATGRRATRVAMDALLDIVVSSASTLERETRAMAERFALVLAVRLDAPAEASSALRLLVAERAAGRLAERRRGALQTAALSMVDGVRAEWRSITPDGLALGEQIAALSLDLAWLLAPPAGSPVPVEEALAQVRNDAPPGASDELLAALGELAREELISVSRGNRAA